MKFSEFISSISVSDFSKWFESKDVKDLAKESASFSRYNIKKADKIFPFKAAIKTYLIDNNLPALTDFRSSNDSRHSFSEKFGFTIDEPLVYNQKDFDLFKDFYEQEVHNNVLFDDFLHHCNQIIEKCTAEPYHIRAALSADRDAMMVMGQRPVIIFSKKGVNHITFLVDRSFDLSDIPHHVRFEFQRNDRKNLVEILIDDWQKIPTHLLQHNIHESVLQYEHVKNKKISQRHQEASTTNSVLKCLLFNNVDVQQFLNSPSLFESIVDYEYPLLLDYRDYFIKTYGKSLNEESDRIVFGFLYQMASPKHFNILTYRDYYNYNMNTLEILKSKINEGTAVDLSHFEEFLNYKLKIMLKASRTKHPLNQVLYGPPGTGKTYNTINKAVGIANPNFLLEQNREFVKEEYNRLVEAGQIVFTTFHQSMTYEDFIEGIKPTMNEDEGELSYEVQNGIFKEICKDAGEFNEIAIVDNFEESWEKLIDLVKEKIANDELLKIGNWEYGLSSKESLKYSSLNSPSQYTFTITKQNIQDTYQNKAARPSKAFHKDMEHIVQFMKSNLALKDRLGDIKKTQKNDDANNFVLIIDEINRGNVSQIFGELITLIEEGKRLGNSEELQVTLPYSKKKFGVPSNLYIIGTMNTADRSVEALDTALRRRFSFVEMMPDSNVVEEGEFKDYPRVDIMEKINQRIELLLDKNYTLGHSYFIKDDFKSSFKNEIIPLLQEYFYNDYGKIGLILGKGFVREKELSKISHQTVFADFDTKNEIEVIRSYELIPFEEVEFQSALDLLLV